MEPEESEQIRAFIGNTVEAPYVRYGYVKEQKSNHVNLKI